MGMTTREQEQEARRLGYTPEEYREIVGRAERIRAERGDRLTPDQLQASAAELGISEQDLREAEQQLRAERETAALQVADRQKRVRLAAVVAACVLAFSLLVGLFTFNGLNARRAAVGEARANLQSALQRKAEVLPQVAAILSSGADRQALAQAAEDLKSGDLGRQIQADNRSRSLAAQPGAGSREASLALVSSLEGTENRINVARTRYAAAARQYNEAAGGFPGSLVARVAGLPPEIPTYSAGK